MSRRLNSPWLLWGDSVQFSMVAPPGGTEGTTFFPPPGQIIRIDYGRPETWTFLFLCQVNTWNVQAEGVGVSIFVDVTPGLGRVQNTLFGFQRFDFAPPIKPGQQLWSSTAVGPVRNADDTLGANVIRTLTFESLTVGARASVNSSLNAGDQIQLELSCYWSPNSHIRPEWFEGMYPGGENETL